MEFESRCKKKRKCECERRSHSFIQSKYQMDIIWIVWDIFLAESKKKPKLVQKIINASLNLFCITVSTNVKETPFPSLSYCFTD